VGASRIGGAESLLSGRPGAPSSGSYNSGRAE
jgi:hypothetical protein